jgi:cobalamin-dependent methionine synthase I
VAGSQEYVPNAVETIRLMKLWEPPLNSVVGLSNVSNQVSHENRGLINRTYLVMLMAVGLDAAIADPFDKELMEFIRIVEQRDDSTPLGRLLLHLYDSTQNMEEFDPGVVDMNDPAQVAIYKTVRILKNEIIFADSYLKM